MRTSKPSKPSLRSFLLANPFSGVGFFLLVFRKGKARLGIAAGRECFDALEVMFIRGSGLGFSRLGFSIALMLFCFFNTDNVFEVFEHFWVNFGSVKLFQKYTPSLLPQGLALGFVFGEFI